MAAEKKIRYSVTHEDGNVSTRTSARTYTHVVAINRPDEGRGWGVYTWCGREDLAVKAANDKYMRFAREHGATVQIVPVDGAGA